MNAELRYYISVFWRRFPLFLLVSVAISAAAIAYALVLPTVYSARGLLLVEEPQIPDSLARSTVQVNEQEQLAIVQQRLLTRANLLDIARTYRVFENDAEMSADAIVERMRASTTFSGSNQRDAATLLEVQFRARSGLVAAQVANEYITRILADNADQRQGRAVETQDFFEQEVARLEQDLSRRNQAILEFQTANSEALPATLPFRMNRQTSLQERLAQLTRERALLEEQRARLAAFSESGASGLALARQGERLSPLEEQLLALRTQLSAVRAVYSETSPRVRTLEGRIASLEEQLETSLTGAAPLPPAAPERSDNGAEALAPTAEAPSSNAAPTGPTSPEMTALLLQIEDLDSRLDFLDGQVMLIEEELVELEQTIQLTPNNTVELENLIRAHSNVERQYNMALDRLAAASTGERIETLSKGQRIIVLEQALPPAEPSDPNRPLIAGAGTALGIAAGFGLIIILEMLNKSIRRPTDLTQQLGITPLATIPYIATTGERVRKRFMTILVLLAIAAGIPAALWYVHYEVMPLDLVLDRIVTRFAP